MTVNLCSNTICYCAVHHSGSVPSSEPFHSSIAELFFFPPLIAIINNCSLWNDRVEWFAAAWKFRILELFPDHSPPPLPKIWLQMSSKTPIGNFYYFFVYNWGCGSHTEWWKKNFYSFCLVYVINIIIFLCDSSQNCFQKVGHTHVELCGLETEWTVEERDSLCIQIDSY